LHFWSGYYCLADKEGTPSEFSQAVAISDVITIISDLGNNIPDKSWMLYLLELFNKQNIPVELNLICSFNDDGKFHAIFGGVNRHEFKIKPEIGHSYLRQIIIESAKKRITYHLKDENSGQTDSFLFNVDSFDFSISKHFTGLEWHNRIENKPYPVRYHVEISNLAYGIHDNPDDLDSLVYLPYDRLQHNSEGFVRDYHVSFNNFQTRNGFIVYEIDSGKQETGIIKKFFKSGI
jgi:hypothetical protein